MNKAEDAVLPIIDVAPLGSDDEAAIQAVARTIGEACRNIGFFYIAGHGVPDDLSMRAYAQSACFFDLPLADKTALAISRSMNNRGYAGLTSESLDPDDAADFKEAFNVGREPAQGEVFDPDLPSAGPNQWPDLPGFEVCMTEYYTTMRRLAERLHIAFAIDLGLPRGWFAPYIDRPLATLRLLRYPAGAAAPDRPGAGAHTDYGSLTILSQDQTGGLEVQTRDGAWIAAPPVPGAFVCNIGDCLMRWSNDTYKSTPHRVMNRTARLRHSIAFFFDPNPDALIACLPTCETPDRPPRYPPVTAADYLRSRLDDTYAFRREGARMP